MRTNAKRRGNPAHFYLGTLDVEGERVVLCDGRPLATYQHIRDHSPTGFNWGYDGAGPAQLALALACWEFGAPLALTCYQDLKSELVARWPQNADWTLTGLELRQWLVRHYEADEQFREQLQGEPQARAGLRALLPPGAREGM